MKKSIILSVVMFALVAFSASAQFSFGGGATMGTKMGVSNSGGDKVGFGINARANYSLPKLDLSGGFTYFFPSAPSGMSMDAWQINVDAHYPFFKKESMKVYALAGITYSYAKAEMDFMGYNISSDDSKIGANLGAGAEFGNIYVEGKYDTAYEQIGISIGYMFKSK